jgi:succinate dehydrogenase/fumarate reductase flavoprotein subunit
VSGQGNGSGQKTAADVVVVGFGAAGIAAAITAHDAGAKVVVLEKAKKGLEGGNTRVSGQVWFSPNDVELAKEYLRGMSDRMPVDEEVAHAWAVESCQNTEWVVARAREAEGNVEVDPADDFGQSTEHTAISYQDLMAVMGWKVPDRDEFPEYNNEGNTDYLYFGNEQGFSRLWLRLKAAVETRDIEVRYGTGAKELVSDDNGKVTGVIVEGPDGTEVIEARGGVVLACGGFENNPDMIQTFLAKPFAAPYGSPFNTGDGIRMAQALGARLSNMYQHMPFYGIKVPGKDNGEFLNPQGLNYINVRKDGKRFIDELINYQHGKPMIGGQHEFYPSLPMWTILDEDTRLAGPLSPTRQQYPCGWLKQVERYDWSEDNSVEIEKGWIVKADTIRELAEKLGVDPDGLEAEVERYNEDVAKGEDTRFGRPAFTLAPIARAPFYGYAWGNMIINTLGGLRKDAEARVIHVDGEAIAGLYAAGEIACTHAWSMSGGQSIGDGLAFGRIAGRNAAAAAGHSAEPATAHVGA